MKSVEVGDVSAMTDALAMGHAELEQGDLRGWPVAEAPPGLDWVGQSLPEQVFRPGREAGRLPRLPARGGVPEGKGGQPGLERPRPPEPSSGLSSTRLARMLRNGVDLTVRMMYDIQVQGRENFTRSPSTLVVANHRRDSDGPIIGSVLLNRQGLRVHGVMPNFVAREDMFHPGFLRDYLVRWPEPIRELLGKLDLRQWLWRLQMYPIRRVPERTLREVLEDVLRLFGNLPLDQILKPHQVRLFQEQAGTHLDRLSLLEVMQSRRFRPLLRQRYGLTRLSHARLRALMPDERETIREQLRWFVDLLERGETVQLEPEGVVSLDGHFARLRGGLHHLLNHAQAPTRVLPVGITYDFMTTGRQRVFVNAGPEILDLRGLSRRETDARVAEAILAQSMVTGSQLASQLLLAIRSQGGGAVTAAQLCDYVKGEATRWKAVGAHVDPRLLDRKARAERVQKYLEFGVKMAMLVPDSQGRYYVRRSGETVPARWSDPDGVLDYVNNELTSFSKVWTEALAGFKA